MLGSGYNYVFFCSCIGSRDVFPCLAELASFSRHLAVVKSLSRASSYSFTHLIGTSWKVFPVLGNRLTSFTCTWYWCHVFPALGSS